MQDTKGIETMVLELRRGVIALAVMAHLREEQYGYSLINTLAETGLEVDQGTLYPLLRRLEGQGWLDSTWKVDGTRPRRYYALNAAGGEALRLLSNEWEKLVDQVNRTIGRES